MVCAAAVVMLMLSSCKTPTNIAYFQDVDTNTLIQAIKRAEIRIKPEDKLQIVVSSQDLALSSMFNLVMSNNRVGSTTQSTKTIGRTISSTSGNGQFAYYTVDRQGDINFPILGKMHIAGMTRSELALYIENRLENEDLLKDPVVSVEYVNTGISVLGEVSSPGRYEFNKDELTILDAIAMAGDLKINGERENILVMRRDADGNQTGYRVNLLDMKTLAQSPVYYLQQDDIVYVVPNNKVKRETTPNGNSPFTPSFWISLGSTALTVATLIISLAK